MMQKDAGQNGKVKMLFTDIGGVLLNNGWDAEKRNAAAQKFHLDAEEMEDRHHLTFDTYEEGKLSLDDYLERIVFFRKRNFTVNDFKKFMFNSSEAYPEMITLFKNLKNKFGFRVAAVNNEGRELNDYRISHFKLNEVIDFFISSSIVHLRKPDVDIFKLALDIAQVSRKEVVFIDDRPMFVQVAKRIGIKSFVHKSFEDTKERLAKYGWAL